MGVFFPEHVTSNFHWHGSICLQATPRLPDVSVLVGNLDVIWKEIVPSGSCQAVEHDEHVFGQTADGWAAYITKEVGKPGNPEPAISTEFIPDRPIKPRKTKSRTGRRAAASPEDASKTESLPSSPVARAKRSRS